MTVEQILNDTPLSPLTRGNTVREETAAYIYPDEKKQLLYRIGSVLRVTSYDNKTVFKPEIDYTVKDGCLLLPAGSRIPVITPQVYYSPGSSPILRVKKPDGAESPCYYPEEGSLSRYQIRVTYTHEDAWTDFVQPPEPERFSRFLRRLEQGKDATVLFYGDSITYGANASFLHNIPPFEPPYPMLFTAALARLYGYTARFAPPEAENAYAGKAPDFPTGTRGVITYVNTAVGGWNSEDGAKRTNTHIVPQVQKYGCDLFVYAFGMNDGSRPPQETAANCEAVIRRVHSMRPDACTAIVSTMLPNPDALGGWNGSHPLHEAAFADLARTMNGEGIPCGVARMTSVSAAVLRRKKFIDYTGNNINHPNDFFGRVYAQTLLQTAVGYDTEIRI